jgi:glutamate carboxypeptidase
VDGAPFHRAGHLVAEHPGHGSRILLIGHLDTVFEKDSRSADSSAFRTAGQKARG